MRRYPEIDLLRTLAILLMVIYHTAFDLSEFYGWDIDVFSGGWKLFARATATLFLLLVGVSAAVSADRETPRRMIYRFVKIGLAALVVTVATYVIDPDTYVRFGILHLIAVSTLLLSILPKHTRPIIAPILGALLLMLSPIVSAMRIGHVWLIPLGIRPHVFVSVDYFPLVPWFGVVLIGYGIWAWGVRSGLWERKLRHTPHSPLLTTLMWPGQHSLLIYLIHQPIILTLLWILPL